MKYGSLLAAFAVFAAPAGALAQSLDHLNPNAVGQAFFEIIAKASGKPRLFGAGAKDGKLTAYVEPSDSAMFCVGTISSKPIDILDSRGKSTLLEPGDLTIVSLSKSSQLDPESKKKLNGVIETKNVVHLEAESVGAPGTNDINEHFSKTYGKKPLLAASVDVGGRGGSMMTLFTIDKPTFEKFVTDNKAVFDKYQAEYVKDFVRHQRFWTDCGLKK